MNILIIGKPLKNLYNALTASKLVEKLYTAFDEPISNIPNIEFQSIDELVSKAKALKVDIAICCDKSLIKSGIADTLRSNRINIFAVNKKWYNLEESRLIAKQLTNCYSINTPIVIKAPVAFPIIIKTDTPKYSYIVNSMSDLVNKTETLASEKTFLEEYLEGDIFELTSLWDGRNLLTFSINGLNEVQTERLDLYKTKLHIMLSDEKADFIGFFVSKLIWAKNEWYLLEFKMRITEHSVFIGDLGYILNSALYQKLNEIQV